MRRLNKYDRLARPLDLSWETYVPKLPELDYTAFNEVLNQQQGQYNQVGLLSEKRPQVLNNDPDMQLYQQYKAKTDQGLTNVTEAYKKGVTQGQMEYNKFLNQIRQDWSPGGEADVLNQRYNSYQAGAKAIDDFYKDDTSPVNKTLAKQELANQLKNPIEFDPQTGRYTSISTPQLYKTANINGAVNEMLKEIKENGTTQWLGSNSDWWLTKIKQETREPERIKLAYQALSSQPEFATQIQRDAQYKKLGINPDQYKADFETKQNNAYKNIEQTYLKAEQGDQEATKDIQSMLRQQGYNVTLDGQFGPQTKKAATEYLQKAKQDVQSSIDSFDLDNQLINDVNNSYLNYALRGAYTKTDIDKQFNQAKKALLEDARKRDENQINRDRLNFEFAAKENSQILVADGLAQQLPEMQKYAQDAKLNRDQLKQKLDQSINNSDVFRGWKLDNIGQAYMKWQNVKGDTEAEKLQNYKAMLNENSDYQFSDQQVQALYEQMMSPDSESSLKTMLQGYGEANNEVSRLEDGQQHLASQYIQTPEGKERLNALKGFRKPGETDLELTNRLIAKPEEFYIEGDGYAVAFDGAEEFKRKMAEDVKKQQKAGMNYDWGSLGTFEIYAGTKDDVLKPVFDMTAQAIETGEGNNFSSFGLMGLQFKDNKGNTMDNAEAKKVGKIAVAKNGKGEPILKIGATMTLPNGKTKDGYTEVALVPGSALHREYKNALEQAYIKKVQQGENPQAQGILDNLHAMEGNFGLKNAAMDSQLAELNLKNTGDDNLMLFDPNQIWVDNKGQTQRGRLIPISNLGWQSKDLLNDEQIGGMKYKTYGLNTPTGNFAADVVIDQEGRKIIVPSETGYTYNSTSGISKQRKGKQILSTADVEITKTKQ